jgi:hypothetical protein
MIRALTTLVGLAGAAAILYFVTDAGNGGGSWWSFAGLWAAAGLVLGILYQSGGRRAPGVRMNVPQLVFAFLPWTVLTGALVAVQAGKPVWLADRGRDIVPDAWIPRWDASLPAFAFGVGLLLAFALIEPRVGIREVAPALDSSQAPIEAYTPYTPPEPASTPVTAVQPAVAPPAEPAPETTGTREPDTAETVVSKRRAVGRRTTRVISPAGNDDPANPVEVIQPQRERDA